MITPIKLLLILVIILIVFGAGKLPKVMGDLGKGINAFKKGLKDGNDEVLEAKRITEEEENKKN